MGWFENEDGENTAFAWAGTAVGFVADIALTSRPLAVASAIQYEVIGGYFTQSSNGETTNRELETVVAEAVVGTIAAEVAGAYAYSATPAQIAGMSRTVLGFTITSEMAYAGAVGLGAGLLATTGVAVVIGIAYTISESIDLSARNNSIEARVNELHEQFSNVPYSDIERMVSQAVDDYSTRSHTVMLGVNTFEATESLEGRLAEMNSTYGPSAGEPGRTGSIDHITPHVTDTTDPDYIGYIGPASGETVTSRTDVVMTRSDEVREILRAGLNAISDIDPLAVLITAATPWTLLSFSSKNHNTYDAPITANASSGYAPSTYYANGALATWHDLNGNGVVDQLQTINTVTNASGGTVETLVNMAIAA